MKESHSKINLAISKINYSFIVNIMKFTICHKINNKYLVCLTYAQEWRRKCLEKWCIFTMQLCDLYGLALTQELLSRGSWNLQFWWTITSGIMSIYIQFVSGVENRKFLKRNTTILHFLPQSISPWGRGS